MGKSLKMIDELSLHKTSSIIDIGGGESRLADYLLEQQFTDISLLDISTESLERTKHRLGAKAASVKLIISDGMTELPFIFSLKLKTSKNI